MLIAQVSDIHFGFEPGNPDELNRQRFAATLDALLALDRRPDLMLATGDLTENGDPADYAALAEAFARCPWPVWPIPGNHDLRAPFRAAFPDVPVAGGFVQYEVDAGPLRILMLDTLEERRHGGAYCPARAAWLDARLAEQPDRATLLVAHHPPAPTGIDWMSEAADAPWAARLSAVVRRHPQVVRLIAGHIHRPIFTGWAGTTLAVCPATAPQLALDPRDISISPDDRAMIVAEPPAYALHQWTGDTLLSHIATAAPSPVLARYTAAMTPLVQSLLAERAGTQSASEPVSETR